jgi:hypothetical protein
LPALTGARLVAGYTIVEVQLTDEPLKDALDRDATALTRITGRDFLISIRRGLTERELSISLHHEVLEAATVASFEPPESVIDFNEGDFERAAQQMHNQFGIASVPKLNAMLQSFGFRGE